MKTFYSFLLLAAVVSIDARSQNLIDNYLSGSFTATLIADGFSSIDGPRDLDFKPNSNELWVVNIGNSNGGTNVIIYNAGLPNQTTQYRKDTHTSHFMQMPTAIAFSDIGEFGTIGESSSSFMGPVVWSSDTNIFARVFQSNWASGFPLGSHLDMLHQSPLGMGIAHDSLERYWVFDGQNGNVCLYDFVAHHGPGYDNHSNGIILRYSDVDVERVANIPSHMVKDKESGWLYIVDNGHNRILRINTNTGVVVDTLQPPGSSQEPLNGYYEMQGSVQESLDTFATRPCGIDLYNGRLIVGDYDNGNIYVYDISASTPVMLGTITTGQAGMQGVKIGPDGKIWFVNYATSEVYRLDPAPVPDDASILEITSPVLANAEPIYFSPGFNLCSSTIEPVVTLLNTGSNMLTAVTINYVVNQGNVVTYAWTGSLASGASTSVTLPSSAVTAGKHKLTAYTSNPNGTTDDNPANDTKDGSFRAINPVSSLPFSEGFTATLFPPPGWDYIHYNLSKVISRNGTVGGFGLSTGCFKMNNFSGSVDISGQIDYLTLPLIDLSSVASAIFEFSVAHARNGSSNDNLKLLVSDDCGLTWSTVYNKSGSTLSTAPATTFSFTPTATQWRRETIDLSAFIGQPEVLCVFSTLSDFGNNLYVDDILIYDQVTTVDEITSGSSLDLFPIPASDELMVRFHAPVGGIYSMQILDASGRIVSERDVQTIKGTNQVVLNVNNLSEGIYSVVLSSPNSILRSKLIIH